MLELRCRRLHWPVLTVLMTCYRMCMRCAASAGPLLDRCWWLQGGMRDCHVFVHEAACNAGRGEQQRKTLFSPRDGDSADLSHLRGF